MTAADLSSVAWQGFGRGLGYETVMKVNETAFADCLPDVVIHLDLDIDAAMARTFDASGDKFEKFPAAFFEKCRDGYRFTAQQDLFRTRWQTVTATGTIEDVFCKVLTALTGKV